MKNAIILAAGKSDRFAPFTYEKPKGLFRVKGENSHRKTDRATKRIRNRRHLYSYWLYEGKIFLFGAEVWCSFSCK